MDPTSVAIDALSVDASPAPTESAAPAPTESAAPTATSAAADGMELVDPIDASAETAEPVVDAAAETELAEPVADPVVDPAAPVAERVSPAGNADIVADGGRLQKDRKGNEVYVFDKAAAEKIHSGYQTMRTLMEKTGLEALTPEAVEGIAKNSRGLIELTQDLNSGNPDWQASAMAYMLGQTAKQKSQLTPEAWSRQVQQTAGAIVAAAQHSHPEVEAALYNRYYPEVTNNIIENLYLEAMKLGGIATTEGKRAVAVAQHLDNQVNGQYRKSEALARPMPDPVELRARDVESREAAIRQREEADSQRQWEDYTQGISQDRNAALDASISESLASVEKAMSAFPEQWKSVKVRLRADAIAAVRSDPAWESTFSTLVERARNAASNEIRVQIRTQLKQAFQQKVRAAIQRIAPPIINEASRVIASGSQQKHDRAAAAQKQRPAVTNGTPASPTIASLAPPGTRLPPAEWAKQIDQLAVRAS